MKPTSAPWIYRNNKIYAVKEGGRLHRIADMVLVPIEESKANAQMMISSQDLYDAANVDLRELGEFFTDDQSEAVRMLKKAIKKAEGKL